MAIFKALELNESGELGIWAEFIGGKKFLRGFFFRTPPAQIQLSCFLASCLGLLTFVIACALSRNKIPTLVTMELGLEMILLVARAINEYTANKFGKILVKIALRSERLSLRTQT